MKSLIINAVKSIFTVLFILTLISTALASISIEAHDGHADERISSAGYIHDSYEHSSESENNSSESKDECPHFHVHCTSLCMGVLLSHSYGPDLLSYDTNKTSFNLHKLSPQDIANSIYRPPIS